MAAAGHYSAVPQSNIIGPEGGRMLVDKTVDIIKELWKEDCLPDAERRR